MANRAMALNAADSVLDNKDGMALWLDLGV
jgi:hypothetical protein